MKKLLAAVLLSVPFFAVPSTAWAWGGFSLSVPGCPLKFEAGANAYVRCTDSCNAPQAGPWYLYWPLEAHFGPPAPTGYPFWPSNMTLPPNGGHGHAMPPPGMMPPMQNPPVPMQQGNVQPVSYRNPLPNYWYSK
jgi:hypothetical protein